MIRIALVEDDAACRRQLREYVERYGAAAGKKITVTEFADGDEIALGYSAAYDIILMDIEMRFMDGMTAAEEIRCADSEVLIIFITNSPQYAIKGYSVNALDYLLKPVSYYALSQRLERAEALLSRRTRRFLQIAARGGACKLDVAQLYWVESHGHELIYHTAGGILTATGSMQETEQKLAQSSFYRCNKGCLVNLEHVDSVEGENAIVHSERVPLARARRRGFMDALNDYINGAGQSE